MSGALLIVKVTLGVADIRYYNKGNMLLTLSTLLKLSTMMTLIVTINTLDDTGCYKKVNTFVTLGASTADSCW